MGPLLSFQSRNRFWEHLYNLVIIPHSTILKWLLNLQISESNAVEPQQEAFTDIQDKSLFIKLTNTMIGIRIHIFLINENL